MNTLPNDVFRPQKRGFKAQAIVLFCVDSIFKYIMKRIIDPMCMRNFKSACGCMP